jgi:hypothetical protein
MNIKDLTKDELEAFIAIYTNFKSDIYLINDLERLKTFVDDKIEVLKSQLDTIN